MKHEEYAIHCALWALYQTAGKPGTFLFHPANKASSAKEGARFKRMGVVPGIPDLVGSIEGRFYGLEIKTESGHLSDVQQICREAIWASNGVCDVGFGFNDAILKLKIRGFL